ncbi:hypothetical protein BGZ63DRAFT_421051 [Mariannaea sp. PMI_226]|nr:hypothetical protein BGZ63DRAFT_421051 [Mariannaea sp. PMI_226]
MSRRHQARHEARPRFDEEFPAYDPFRQQHQPPPFDAFNPYDQYAPRDPYRQDPFPPEPRSSFHSPPRRHKSKSGGHRRAPSPVYYSDSPPASPRHRRHGRSKYDDEPRGRSTGPPQRGRGFTPPPIIPHPDEPPQQRKKSRSSRHKRGGPSREEPDFLHERDPRWSSNPYEQQEFNPREPPSRQYPPDPRQRSFQEPGRENWAPSSRSSARDAPPDSRHRGRSSRHFDGGDDNNDPYMAAGRHRRPRSKTRGRQGRTTASSPSPTRGRPPPSQRNREPTKRRSSMPATTSRSAAAVAAAAPKAATKTAIRWWQNPLLQAGARTALTAGAQAAMNSRKEEGQWLGAKGAKVATAALGAALVDGVMGQKHPNSVRQGLAKQGVNLATGKVGETAGRRGHHH